MEEEEKASPKKKYLHTGTDPRLQEGRKVGNILSAYCYIRTVSMLFSLSQDRRCQEIMVFTFEMLT